MKRSIVIKAICLISIIVFVLLTIASVVNSRYDFHEETYYVKGGDRLWNIASDYCPDGMDVRDYLNLLREHNEFTGSVIYPGQEIIVLVEH